MSPRRPVSARPALHASGGPYSARLTAVYNLSMADVGGGEKETNARLVEWYGLPPRGMDPSLRPPSERAADESAEREVFGSMLSARRLQPRTSMELMIHRHHQPAVAARRNAPAPPPPPPPRPAATPRPAAHAPAPAMQKPKQMRRAPSPPKPLSARTAAVIELRPTTQALRPPAVPTPAMQRPSQRKSKDAMGAPVTAVAVAGAPSEEQSITPNWAVLGEQTAGAHRAAAPAQQPRLDRFSRYVGA